MSIVIIPSTHPAATAGSGSAAGKLATTLLSVMAAGMAEPMRFRRGRALVADRAVLRLEVAPGLLRATVMGSRPDPYQVEVAVSMLPRSDDSGAPNERAEVMRLCPDGDEVDVFCSCPDDEVPCKHVVAALLCFGTEVGHRPELLAEWRCGEALTRPRATIGGRARAERHLRLVPPPPPPSPFVTDAWRAFEGTSGQVPDEAEALAHLGPLEPLSIRTALVDHVDVGAVVQSAIDTLAGRPRD